MAEAREVSIVIPAFNEEGGIGAVVTGIRAVGPFAEVLVVDDGSTDATAAQAEAAGARVTFVSLAAGEIQGVRHDVDKTLKVVVDRTIRDVSAKEFDAVHLPGGTVNADSMRIVPEVQAFLRAMQEAGKPIAAICHAPWELISADLVRGRTLTSYHTIQDDLRNAGAHWLDREVVEDGNWVTSRQPGDLPAFNRAMLALFSRSRASNGITPPPQRGIKRVLNEQTVGFIGLGGMGLAMAANALSRLRPTRLQPHRREGQALLDREPGLCIARPGGRRRHCGDDGVRRPAVGL